MDQAEQLRNVIKLKPMPKPLARVLTVTSGKGGVGKSNTSINLACQFKRWVYAKYEIKFGTVPKHNLSDLIYKGKNITQIITWGPMEIGFISGGSGIAGLSNLNGDNLNYIITNLAELDSLAEPPSEIFA